MSLKPKRIIAYDTETSGLSPFYDQMVQFAGIAVDSDLNYIPGDELVLDIKLRTDVVPSPKAFSVHGISIEDITKGYTEFEAAGHIKNWFCSRPDTLITGFNTLRFDDEVIRNTFYRTMLDPYEHEFSKGNAKADIFRLILLVYGLRPEVLNWPMKPDGSYSLKLGDLAAANGIELTNAHDARCDVVATIELMRLVKQKAPKLWNYFLSLSDKNNVKSMADKLSPLVLVDPFMPRTQGHTSIVLPVIYDEQQKQKMLCIDLREDPGELLKLSSDEIRRRVFTPLDELESSDSIRSIRSVITNKQPLIAPLTIFNNRPDVVLRAGLDISRCLDNARLISADKGFRKRLQDAFKAEHPPCPDVYQGIYSLGFFGRDEKVLRSRNREMRPAPGGENDTTLPAIASADPFRVSTEQAQDRLRMFELSLRAKWSNFGDEVLAAGNYSSDELEEWIAHLERVWGGDPGVKGRLDLAGYELALAEVRAETPLDDKQEKALSELETYVQRMKAKITEMRAAFEATKEAESLHLNETSKAVEIIDHDRKVREARESSKAESGLAI